MSGGGKLGRTETVTVRLDPEINALCDLAAHTQRRTKSSFIEWAIVEALKCIDPRAEAERHHREMQAIRDRLFGFLPCSEQDAELRDTDRSPKGGNAEGGSVRSTRAGAACGIANTEVQP